MSLQYVMVSSLAKWEADPFFPAAEEVQNSADRMESALRSWKHVKGLGRLNGGARINTYRRELITALDTVKWQLQEFERAVEAAVGRELQHRDKDAPSRHAVFVGAIRSQVHEAEKVLEEAAEADDLAATRIHNKPEDGDSLVKFLSGSSQDLEDGSSSSHHFFGIMQSEFGGLWAGVNTEESYGNFVDSISENTPAASGLRSPGEFCHDSKVVCSVPHLHKHRDEGSQFANGNHESVQEKPPIPPEDFPDTAYNRKNPFSSCGPHVWMPAGVNLEVVCDIPESETAGSCPSLWPVSKAGKGTGCSRFLIEGLDNGKDREDRSMEGCKDVWPVTYIKMFKHLLVSSLKQVTKIRSCNSQKVRDGYGSSEFYSQQQKRGITVKKAVQLQSWMQQQIPHGRILQILSAFLILISFMGISIM